VNKIRRKISLKQNSTRQLLTQWHTCFIFCMQLTRNQFLYFRMNVGKLSKSFLVDIFQLLLSESVFSTLILQHFRVEFVHNVTVKGRSI
jgi:hypothetical protein